MKQATFLRNRQASFLTAALLVAAILIGLAGTRDLGKSSAATAYNHSPFGGADQCQLVGGKTVIYGWAYDADAPVGAQPYLNIKVGAGSYPNIPSSISGYRDAPINAYLKKNNPGAPTSSVYGWQLQIANLYKGTSYVVSGTIVNYGAGSSVAMTVYSGSSAVDGKPANTFTAAKALPDACLATRPAPAPTPAPAPAPAPAPPTPTKSSGSSSRSSAPAAAPAAPTPTADANASVASGTTAANLTIPAGNATTIRVLYGADGGSSADLPTAEQPTNGADTIITLTGLTAKTKYHYQIARMLNGQTATSPTAEFTTSGYNATLLLTAGGKPVKGIVGELDKAKATSDKDGKLTFKNLAEGSYSVRFTYQSHTYSQTISTDTAASSNDPTAIMIDQPVNLDDLQPTAALTTTSDKKRSGTPGIIIVIVLILLIGGGVWFFIRRRNRSAGPAAYPSAAPLPKATPASGDILDQHSRHHLTKKPLPAAEPLPEHAGKSLRELVVESMRAEAVRRKDDGSPPPPHVPGGK